MNDSREFLPFRTQQKHYLSLSLRNKIEGAHFFFKRTIDNVPKHTSIKIKEDYANPCACMFNGYTYNVYHFPQLTVLSS